MRYRFRGTPLPLDALEATLDGDPLHTPPNEVGNLSAGLTGNEHDATPPHERRFDSGNKVWCATLPPGQYEIADEPDGEEMLAVHRIGDGGERELVLKLPAADYVATDDEAGMHVHRVPEGENAASLLNGQTTDAAIPNRRTGEMVQLHRLNAFHRARAWDREPATHPKTSEATPLLARMNAKNRKFYSGGDDAA